MTTKTDKMLANFVLWFLDTGGMRDTYSRDAIRLAASILNAVPYTVTGDGLWSLNPQPDEPLLGTCIAIHEPHPYSKCGLPSWRPLAQRGVSFTDVREGL